MVPRSGKFLGLSRINVKKRPKKPSRKPPEPPIGVLPYQPIPVPKPRTDKPVPKPRTDKPVPKPRTHKPVPKIDKLNKALKGNTASYKIGIQDNLDSLKHSVKTKDVTESLIKESLETMKGLKFIVTLEVTFEKDTFDPKTGEREKTYRTVYFNSKDKAITNANDIEPELYTAQQEIMGIVEVWISEGLGWTISKLENNYINFVKYKPLNGSSYIELPAELRNSGKGLINMKNKDDECFRWCHIRHLNPQKKDPQRIKKDDKQYIEKLDYTNIVFPVSQKQYNKIEKRNCIRINVFGYEERQPFPIYISKEKFEGQMNLLLITKDEKRHFVLMKVHVQPIEA